MQKPFASPAAAGPQAAGRQPPAQPRPGFEPGDRLPNFRFPDRTGQVRDFHAEVAGRPALLVLAPRLTEEPAAALLQLLRAQAAGERDLELYLVGGERGQALPDLPGALAISDEEGRMTRMLCGEAPFLLLALDANQRALAVQRGGEPLAAVSAALGAVTAWRAFAGERRAARGPAPVLLLPRVLPPELCGQLIGLWEGGNQEGKVSSGGNDNFYSPDRKKNREHVVSDPEMTRLVALYVSRRVGPELAKAFVYTQPYRFESFIVLGYSDERQDFFGRHRDRYLPDHPRRFAMSLNLNDDYEGGELCFPEYSNDLYRPPPGGACVFSCSLLHEALPVRRGRRFTMTTFFHAAPEQGAPQRG